MKRGKEKGDRGLEKEDEEGGEKGAVKMGAI